jgi:hypothetical protein
VSARLAPLPDDLAATREALRTVACYVVAPARRVVDGHIGLRPGPGGFGTPVVGDPPQQVRVERSSLVVLRDGVDRRAPVTTLEAAAGLVGLDLAPDPGVGTDLPAFDPVARLPIGDAAAAAIGAWYALGDEVLAQVAANAPGSLSESTLWPEHFDLAAVHRGGDPDDASRTANVGFSPGDATTPEPYLYVGPWQRDGLDDPIWNVSYGAQLGHADLAAADDPVEAALAFISRALTLLAAPR